jgi:hypothetical protein
VLAHARALLTGAPAGRTAYIDARLQDVDRILAAPELHDTLDLTEPVALLLFAVLHCVDDDEDLYGIGEGLMAALPAGSYLVLSRITADYEPERWEQFAAVMRGQGITTRLRSQPQVTGFFAGLDLVDPGVVPILRWRPDSEPSFTDAQVALYGGVARKP